MKKPIYINIVGNIATGKSTLCTLLCNYFNWVALFSEAHKSPFLKEFYNKKSNAIQNQLYVLIQSLNVNKNLFLSDNVVCQDYCIYEHNNIYSKAMRDLGHISSIEYELLVQLIVLFEPLKKPNLLIYLQADVDTLITRIKKRGRQEEKNVNVKYLQLLSKKYEEFVLSWSICPVISFSSTTLNFFKEDDLGQIINKINQVINHLV